MNAPHILLDGKKILVTGAGKGIGREICCLLAAGGAEVIAVSRTSVDLESLATEIPCKTITADLADAAQAIASAERAIELAGQIDCLVNNAGISIPQPLLETTIDAFDRTMAVNVRAVLLVTQVIAKHLIARKSPGTVVNLSSQASMAALVDHAAYCASKGGLDMLTKVMALELGPHQIRVNAVNPTVTLTPMGEMAWGDPAKSMPMLAKIPLGRFARPIHVANAVAYLLSDAADMINGVTLPIDGGFLAQ